MSTGTRDRRVAALAHRLADAGAAAGRSRVQAAAGRVRVGAWPVLQCALAAAVAWGLASQLLDHPAPLFAPVAAVVCLSARTDRRLRRIAELAVGVSLGVLVGEGFVSVLGTGAWQVGLVVGVALLLALALDGGTLLTAQAGLQAVFVLVVPREPGSVLARWQDALVGGATALLVAALLPGDPWRLARRTAATAAGGLELALREAARALRDEDVQHAAEALSLARDTHAALDAWHDALAVGRDTSRLSPLHRHRGDAAWSVALARQQALDRASRNARVVLRRLLSAQEVGEQLPDELPDLLDGLADLLPQREQVGFAEAVTAYGRRLDLKRLPATSVSGVVAVAQLRAVVVDLLEGEGWERYDAREALPSIL